MLYDKLSAWVYKMKNTYFMHSSQSSFFIHFFKFLKNHNIPRKN